MKAITNKILSQIFQNMAQMYRYLGPGERFRALAYQKVARVLISLPEDVETYVKENTLVDIPGIGESIAEKIKEFLKTGKIRKYEQLKKKVPHELLEMLDIKGFGPRTLETIHKQLGIQSKAQLIEALNKGKISELKGFGIKKVEGMLRSLKIHKAVEERMLLWNAFQLSEDLLSEIRKIKGVNRAEVAGSIRRAKETIGDIDVLIACDKKSRKKIIADFLKLDINARILAKGETKLSLILNDYNKQLDLRLIDEDEWGSALQYFTGSKEHNIHLRTLAREKGFKISEYGLFLMEGGEKYISGTTEKNIYKALNLQFIPPEMREDKGEIELAIQNKIPRLISLRDIKGDLHIHSVWSDGTETLEEIYKYLKEKSDYEYFAITDHSKSSRIAHGMDEKKVLKQIKEIHALNKRTGINQMKTGIEVDILDSGELDLPDEILAQLNWVTASVHSGFNRDNTDRIIKACRNPYVSCIGHPTGRLIGKREGYKFNLDAVIDAALETHTALEINAQPDRMDLNDEMVWRCREKGVKLVISTDSHTPDQFLYMKAGVSIARRAWCTASDILNTYHWPELEKFRALKLK